VLYFVFIIYKFIIILGCDTVPEIREFRTPCKFGTKYFLMEARKLENEERGQNFQKFRWLLPNKMMSTTQSNIFNLSIAIC